MFLKRWFGSKDGERQPDRYSRRQLLRGSFLRHGRDEGWEPTEQEGGDETNETTTLDLRSFLAAADPSAPDPSAGDRAMPPGYDQMVTAPPRRHGSVPVLRPPGAVAEESFLQLCTRCNDCVTACPHDAIRLAPPRYKGAAGTPMIDPFAAPCHMCEDAPCISACETGALHPELPRIIGAAHLQTYNCLAHNQSICTVCYERCPVEGAITLIENRPHIVAEQCNGCGVCHSVCPAPINAIMIMPLPNRPSPPAPPTPTEPLP